PPPNGIPTSVMSDAAAGGKVATRGTLLRGRYRSAMTSDDGVNRPIRHSGPVVLRGRAVPRLTEDQRLLDSRLSDDWKTRDAWRSLRILSEFVEGFDTLSDL